MPGPLGGLVERAACDPILAAALLRRPDLGTFDRAVLFAAADSLTRDAIRAELDGALAPAHRHLPDASTAFRDRVVQAAGLGTARAVSEMLKERLPLLDTGRLDLSQPAGQELFVLALGAAGLAAEDSIRIVLTLDVDVARSVAIVFRLAEVARSTSRRAGRLPRRGGACHDRAPRNRRPSRDPQGRSRAKRSANRLAQGPSAGSSGTRSSPERPSRSSISIHHRVPIESDLAPHPGRDVGARRARQHGREHPIRLLAGDQRLRGRAVEVARAVETVDADVDGAGLRGPPTSQDGVQPLDRAAAQPGLDPEIRPESRQRLASLDRSFDLNTR